MITLTQKRGTMVGLIWGLLSWIPYYTDSMRSIRGILGIPATLGLNLELALGRGDAFIYSLLLAMGLGFFFMTIVHILRKSIKVIAYIPRRKKKRLSRRGF